MFAPFVATVTGGWPRVRSGSSLSSSPSGTRRPHHSAHHQSREREALLSGAADHSFENGCHEQGKGRTGGNRCVKHQLPPKLHLQQPESQGTRRWSASGRIGGKRTEDHRKSSGGSSDRRSSSATTFSLTDWTTPLLASLVDNWIKNMRIKKMVSCKMAGRGERDRRLVEEGIVSEDSCPRVVLLSRRNDHPLADGSPPLTGVVSGLEVQLDDKNAGKNKVTVTPAPEKKKDQEVRKAGETRRAGSACRPSPSSLTSAPSSSSPAPASADPGNHISSVFVPITSGKGGDSDGEQVRRITGQAIILIEDQDDEKRKKKKTTAKANAGKAEERRDVNGNFGDEVAFDATTASDFVTVTPNPLILFAAASSLSTTCFAPVSPAPVDTTLSSDPISVYDGVAILPVEGRALAGDPASGATVVLSVVDKPSDRRTTDTHLTSCSGSPAVTPGRRPAVVTCSSCMAGQKSASLSPGSPNQQTQQQPQLPVNRDKNLRSLRIECVSCSVHSPPSPALSSPKSPHHPEDKFSVNPAFTRPSTSTSVNSIVIEDTSISGDDEEFNNSLTDVIITCEKCGRSGPGVVGPAPDENSAAENQKSESESESSERTWTVLKELILAFLLAGLGNVAASYWLAKVQSWSVFKNIPQLVILVPPLLGLKGNVEMTLASRLSTHANLGDLDSKSSRRQLILGNMALIQCQASTVGFVAPIIALGMSLMSERPRFLRWPEIVLLVASSVITANVANLLLGTLMCGVVLLARKHNINPDNIATPIAASLGDVTTMILLANISHFLYVSLDANQWVQNALLAFLMSLIPVWAYIARKNPYTSKVIVSGWYPVCGAMLIQNAGGLVMERALKMFDRIANLQLLINGLGGNLVAIQSSRMSTHLHKYSVPKELPKSDSSTCTFPGSTFVSRTSVHTPMARILLSLAIPSHLMFLLVTEWVNKKYFLTAPFILIYVTIGAVHVAILLQLAYNFVHWLWRVGVNPDNTAIPFLTAFADLVGSVLLFTSFVLLFLCGDPNAYDASRFPASTHSNFSTSADTVHQ